jgi:4'-phosphopantetheinyl transferase
MNIEIEDNHIHVWQARIDTSSGFPEEILNTLSQDERERAHKFQFQKDREHYILRHYQLRLILSKYCGCQPHEIKFRYNSYKKPFIFMPEFKEIKFNISFSHDLMLVGLNKHKDIGIDIEKVHEIHDLETLAVNNFSSQELKALNENLDKTKTFFTIWTRKEAFIKATGKGMYYPLKSFCVNIISTGSCERPVIFNRPIKSRLWRIAELITSEGYIASLAIKSNKFQISYFQL